MGAIRVPGLSTMPVDTLAPRIRALARAAVLRGLVRRCGAWEAGVDDDEEAALYEVKAGEDAEALMGPVVPGSL